LVDSNTVPVKPFVPPNIPLPPIICPVVTDAQHVLDASHNLSKAMHRLRRSLNRCKRCENGDCPAILALNSQIKACIEELVEEWHLDS